MTAPAMAARWTAIAVAAAAVLDPAVPMPGRARPAVRVTVAHGDADGRGQDVARQLRDAGFRLDEPDGEVAEVLVGDRVPRPASAPSTAPSAPSTAPSAPSTAPSAPSTEHSAPSTEHSAPSTEHSAPSTEHSAPSTEHSASSTEHSALSTEHSPLWVLDTTPRVPGVRIVAAIGPAMRLPGQAIEVRATLDARGQAGKTSELVLEDAGLAVASVRHAWTADAERWQASLQYLPPDVAGGRLRVRIDGDAADVGVPPVRGPIRTLVLEAGVTWPAMFLRRAIEGEPAFAVAAVQRASTRIATRAGAPPRGALTREALAPFEAAVIGAPDNLTAGELEALKWFVEERGGLAVVIPDRRPAGRYVELLGSPVFEPRVLETPASLQPPALPALPALSRVEGSRVEGNAVEGSAVEAGLQASELLIARRLPPGSRTLASTGSGEAVVFSARRGAGAVIFSGAVDAWRYRAREGEAFGRFWRRAIAEEAATATPVLEVSAVPSLVATGEATRVRARLRGTELPAGADSLDLGTVTARAVSPGAHVDAPLRLWPTAEPGVYEGEWRPAAPGAYNITVTAGPQRGDAAVTVADAVSHGSAADPEGLALVARASGGRVFPADRSAALVDEMKKAFPARTTTRTINPMRSPWWVVPFAGLLCAEWAVRRKQGNR